MTKPKIGQLAYLERSNSNKTLIFIDSDEGTEKSWAYSQIVLHDDFGNGPEVYFGCESGMLPACDLPLATDEQIEMFITEALKDPNGQENLKIWMTGLYEEENNLALLMEEKNRISLLVEKHIKP